jgi:hypothetical protein
VIFSAERLFTLGLHRAELEELLDLFRAKACDFEIVLVVRAIEPFLRSYLRQLASNGMFYIENLELASWCIACVSAFWRLPEKVTTISFERCKVKGDLIATFFDTIGAPAKVEELHENSSSGRSVAFEAALGVICRMLALIQDRDVNAPEIDRVRDAIVFEYDRTVSADGTGVALEVFDSMGDLILDVMNQYIASCVANVSDEDSAFLRGLLEAGVSHNWENGVVPAGGGRHPAIEVR